MNELKLTIGEVARQAELRSLAIRYYEDIGVLPIKSWMKTVSAFSSPSPILHICTEFVSSKSQFLLEEQQCSCDKDYTRQGKDWE